MKFSFGFARAVRFSGSATLLATVVVLSAAQTPEPVPLERVKNSRGHVEAVTDLCFSPDGQVLASASRDGTVRLWNCATGAPIEKILQERQGAHCVRYEPDGKSLLIADGRGLTRRDASAYGKLPPLGGGVFVAPRVEFAPNGKYLIGNTFSKTLRVWDADREPLKTMTTETYGWSAGAVSGDGLLAVADGEGVCVIYQLPEFKEKQRFEAGGYGMRLTFSPRGRWLAVSVWQRELPIRIWDLEQGKFVRQMMLDTPARELAFSADGERLFAVGGHDSKEQLPPGMIRVTPFVAGWNTKDWSRAFETHEGEEPSMGLAVSPDGKLLATGDADGTIRLADARTGKVLRTIAGERPRPVVVPVILTQRKFEQMGATRCVAVTPNGNQAAAGSSNGEATIWNTTNGEVVKVLKGFGRPVEALSYSPDGSRLLLAAGNDAQVLDDQGNIFAEFKGHEARITSAVYLPDGQRVLTGGEDAAVCLWDVKTSKLIQRLPGHTATVWALDASPDGRLLVSGGDDKSIRVWNAATGEPIKTIAHDAAIFALRFTPDGKSLLAGGWDYPIHVWDPVSGQSQGSFLGNWGWTESLSISRDGKVLSASSTVGVKLWDLDTRRPIVEITHPNGFYASPPPDANGTDAALAPDASWVASTGPDGNLVLTDFRQYLREHPFEGQAFPMASLETSADGSLVAAGGPYGAVVVWDATEGREHFTSLDLEGPVVGLKFSPDSRWLAAASRGVTEPKSTGKLLLMEARTGKVTTVLGHAAARAIALDYSPDGKLLATCHVGGNVQLHNPLTNQLVKEITTTGPLTAVFSPDGRQLVTGCADGLIRVWGVPELDSQGEITGHSGAVNCLAFSSDGKWLASGSDDPAVRVWSWPDRASKLVLDQLPYAPSELRFTPKGDRVLAAFRGAEGLIGWSLPDGAEYHTTRMMFSRQPVSGHVTLLADGEKALTTWSRQLKVWKVYDQGDLPRVARQAADRPKRTSQLELRSFGGQGDVVHSLEYLAGGDRLLGRTSRGVARLWDVASGKPIWSIGSEEAPISMVRAAPDGKRIAVGRAPHPVTLTSSVDLVDAGNGEVVATLGDHQGTVHSGLFTADGKTLVTGAGDSDFKQSHGELAVWDIESRQQKQLTEDLLGPVTQLWFADHDRFLLGHVRPWRDGEARLVTWDASDWTPRNERAVIAEVVHREEWNPGPQVSDEGRVVGTTYERPAGKIGRMLVLWDVATQQDRASEAMRALSNPELVSISRDGTLVAHSSHQERIEIWNAEAGTLVGYLRPADIAERPDVMQFTRDGKLLIAAGYHLSVWDHAARKCLVHETNFGGPIVRLVLAPNGETMATAHADTTVRIWKVPPAP